MDQYQHEHMTERSPIPSLPHTFPNQPSAPLPLTKSFRVPPDSAAGKRLQKCMICVSQPRTKSSQRHISTVLISIPSLLPAHGSLVAIVTTRRHHAFPYLTTPNQTNHNHNHNRIAPTTTELRRRAGARQARRRGRAVGGAGRAGGGLSRPGRLRPAPSPLPAGPPGGRGAARGGQAGLVRGEGGAGGDEARAKRGA